MKSLTSFLKTTITGGILFLLPLVLILILLGKGLKIIFKISEPLSAYLPDRFFGLDGSITLTILILIFICFLGGLLYRSTWAKKFTTRLETNILNNMPGYALMKSLTVDTIGQEVEHNMNPILIHEETSWLLAFLVEEKGDLSTVFIPDAPRFDAGEVKIIPSEQITKLNVSTKVFSRVIKNYGKGAIEWIN